MKAPPKEARERGDGLALSEHCWKKHLITKATGVVREQHALGYVHLVLSSSTLELHRRIFCFVKQLFSHLPRIKRGEEKARNRVFSCIQEKRQSSASSGRSNSHYTILGQQPLPGETGLGLRPSTEPFPSWFGGNYFSES